MGMGQERTYKVKSVRHKHILDTAAEHPDASMEELASMVPSATTDLVERVLDKYGDPAEDGPDDDATAGEGDGGVRRRERLRGVAGCRVAVSTAGGPHGRPTGGCAGHR